MLARAHKTLSWDRSAVLLGVIGLHVGGIYLVSVYGGFTALVEKTASALTVVRLPETPRTPPEPARPPVPLQQVHRYEPQVPAPLYPEIEGADRANEITLRPADPGVVAGGEARVPRTAPTPLMVRSRRSTDDYYPPVSIRMGEQGVAIIRVCVGATGELQGTPQVEHGSRHARLDAAAVAWASEALTFTPATANGSPIGSCKGFRVRFALR